MGETNGLSKQHSTTHNYKHIAIVVVASKYTFVITQRSTNIKNFNTMQTLTVECLLEALKNENPDTPIVIHIEGLGEATAVRAARDFTEGGDETIFVIEA